ncbi:MAG: alpha/beta fold hydrolase [Halobacteriota archaeon]
MNQDQFINAADGEQIFVHCEGYKGNDPMVLVHGMPLNHDMWRCQIDDLKNKYYVVAPDLRGFGQSQPSDPLNTANYSYQQWADDLLAVVNALQLHDIHLAGISMGGAVVMQYMSKYMSTPYPPVKTLTLVAATGPNLRVNLPFPTNLTLQGTYNGLGIFSNLIHYLSKGAFDQFIDFMFPVTNRNTVVCNNIQLGQWIEDMFNSVADQAIMSACDEMRNRDLTQGVQKITTPTKICHGFWDSFVPFTLGKYQFGCIIGRRSYKQFDLSGHGIVFEQSKKLSAELDWNP